MPATEGIRRIGNKLAIGRLSCRVPCGDHPDQVAPVQKAVTQKKRRLWSLRAGKGIQQMVSAGIEVARLAVFRGRKVGWLENQPDDR